MAKTTTEDPIFITAIRHMTCAYNHMVPWNQKNNPNTWWCGNTNITCFWIFTYLVVKVGRMTTFCLGGSTSIVLLYILLIQYLKILAKNILLM